MRGFWGLRLRGPNRLDEKFALARLLVGMVFRAGSETWREKPYLQMMGFRRNPSLGKPAPKPRGDGGGGGVALARPY